MNKSDRYNQTKVRLCLKQADMWAEVAKKAPTEAAAQHARERQKHYLDKIRHLLN